MPLDLARMSVPDKRKIGLAFAFLTAAIVFVVACWNIVMSPIAGDGAIFFAVGRGILNGLKPYWDLFETKPPGIFLLSALAIEAGGAAAAQLFTVAALVAIAASGWVAFGRTGLLLGVLLALLTAVAGGEFYPEAFGAAAICVYVALLARTSPQWSAVVACSIALLIAVMFKEPMLLAALAVALLVLRDARSLIWLYAVPQLIALAMFAAILLLTGTASYYFSIYLPFMAEVRVGAAENSGMSRLAFDLFAFSPLLIPLVAASYFAERSGAGRARWVAAAVFAFAASLMGGYEPHHAVAAVPVLFAMLGRGAGRRFAVPAITCAILAMPLAANAPIVGPFAYPFVDDDKQTAAALDSIMDRCGEARYQYLGSPSAVYGYTRHSPVGPLFFLNYFTLRNAAAVEQTLQNMRQVNLILFEKKTRALHIEKQFYDLTQQEVVDHFGTKPWPCAGGTIDTPRFVLLFRTGRH